MGGYDQNRFVANNVTIPMAPDNERDLLVYINGIGAADSANNVYNSLLPTAVYAFIDSTVAEIWLPMDACYAFEKAFGLSFDNTTQLYFVSDAQHSSLLKINPNITFAISGGPGLQSVQITLPYSAFDQVAKSPYQGLTNDQKYFPLRRAVNDTQYTLGRTFLQEAYLIADWERQNFSVSQCSWIPNTPQLLIPITSLNGTNTYAGTLTAVRSSSPISVGAVVGIVFGVSFLLIIIGVLSCLLWRSNRRKQQKAAEEEFMKKKIGDVDSKEDPMGGHVIPKVELDAGEDATLVMPESGFVEKGKPHYYWYSCKSARLPITTAPLVEAPENEVFELPGDLPENPEADGRELSEKEAIRVREARYNGVEEAAPAYSPISPLSPGNQIQGSHQQLDAQGNSISPITPSDNRTLATSKRDRKKKITNGADIQIVRDASGGSGSSRGIRGTPGERLEQSDGYLKTETDGSPPHKRFSYETGR